MANPRITVVTAVYKRHHLTKYVLNKYRMLQEKEDETGVSMSLVAVGSEGSLSRGICEKRKFAYVEAPNMPLNVKWMAALHKAKETNPDAVMFVNSDDVMSSDYFFKSYETMMNAGVGFFGIRDLYFMNMRDSNLMGQIFYWPGYVGHRRDVRNESIGAGRLFSREMLEKVNWQLWKPGVKLPKCLDGECYNYIVGKLGVEFITKEMKELDVAGVDIKTEINISPIKRYSKDGRVIKGLAKDALIKKLGIQDIFKFMKKKDRQR